VCQPKNFVVLVDLVDTPKKFSLQNNYFDVVGVFFARFFQLCKRQVFFAALI
jgi:hypothetical protein